MASNSLIILIHFKIGLVQIKESNEELDELLLKSIDHAVILRGEKTIMNRTMTALIES